MAKIAILGYGNLGRGVECAVKQAPDMELVAVFTRRDPATVKIQTAGVPVLNVSEMEAWKDKCYGPAGAHPEVCFYVQRDRLLRHARQDSAALRCC